MAALLALASALSYGVGDFLGGEGGRRSSSTQMSMLVQGIGVVAAAGAVAVAGRSAPSAAALWWGALSGVGSAVGNLALYRGLAQGAMTVVAPLSAMLTAVVPAVVGLTTGDRLPVPGWIGLGLALPAIGMVSLTSDDVDRGAPATGPTTPAPRRVRAGVGWGLLAGGGFGLLFVALDRAGTEAFPWPLLPGQIVAVAVVLAITVPLHRRAARTDPGARRWRPGLAWGVAAGLGGAGGNLLYFAATGAGQLTVVAVLTALYPAVTVVLAAVVLHERTSRVQLLGLGAAAGAVALIAGA